MLIKTNHEEVTEFRAARPLLGRPLYNTHFFLLDGLLIDTGPHNIAAEIRAALKGLKLQQAVITHQHEDHTGNCAMLQQEFGIPVYAHPETIKILKNPLQLEIYRKIMWGTPPKSDATPLEKVIITKHYQIQVIYTGGHSLDHVCYYEPENRWLFAGDFYLGESLTGFMVGENIVQHLRGLEYLIGLRPTILFCGLKGKLEDATERLIRKYNTWWNLCCKVAKLHKGGASYRQILKEAFGGEIFFYYFSQSNWGRRYMLDTIIANIDFFEAEHKKESL